MAIAAVVAEATCPLCEEGAEDVLWVGPVTRCAGIAARVASRSISGRRGRSVDKGGHGCNVIRARKF